MPSFLALRWGLLAQSVAIAFGAQTETTIVVFTTVQKTAILPGTCSPQELPMCANLLSAWNILSPSSAIESAQSTLDSTNTETGTGTETGTITIPRTGTGTRTPTRTLSGSPSTEPTTSDSTSSNITDQARPTTGGFFLTTEDGQYVMFNSNPSTPEDVLFVAVSDLATILQPRMQPPAQATQGFDQSKYILYYNELGTYSGDYFLFFDPEKPQERWGPVLVSPPRYGYLDPNLVRKGWDAVIVAAPPGQLSSGKQLIKMFYKGSLYDTYGEATTKGIKGYNLRLLRHDVPVPVNYVELPIVTAVFYPKVITTTAKPLDAYAVITSAGLQSYCFSLLGYKPARTTGGTTSGTGYSTSTSTSTKVSVFITPGFSVTSSYSVTIYSPVEASDNALVRRATTPKELVSYDATQIKSGCSRAVTPGDVLTTYSTGTSYNSVSIFVKSTGSTTTSTSVSLSVSAISGSLELPVPLNGYFQVQDQTLSSWFKQFLWYDLSPRSPYRDYSDCLSAQKAIYWNANWDSSVQAYYFTTDLWYIDSGTNANLTRVFTLTYRSGTTNIGNLMNTYFVTTVSSSIGPSASWAVLYFNYTDGYIVPRASATDTRNTLWICSDTLNTPPKLWFYQSNGWPNKVAQIADSSYNLSDCKTISRFKVVK
ncbi:hypothetical protein H072_3911 [Dactylellina haptotyla CBS 200.50]|uniref:PA14 domain-containing protein n=1 Tax=Dactylellina haptotyla (strain CBS 200.50) TaxID=1284197 RepID=S8AH51_DACHA|nr:hypothetical protein H072_3911 [Dactylellina haptotyla CBS 200.50]